MMNGQETEVKFYVRDLPRVETRLRKLQARLIQPRVFETNLRFDLPDGSLRAAGRVLRLRQDAEARLTYKGPGKAEGDVLSRVEIEFTVESFESARQFLEALGYQAVIAYEKHRATYELAGTHIMLDELPYGEFVEIEGEDAPSIRAAADALGLKWNAMVKAGYHALFERLCKKYRLDASQLTFTALQNVHPTAEELMIVPAD